MSTEALRRRKWKRLPGAAAADALGGRYLPLALQKAEEGVEITKLSLPVMIPLLSVVCSSAAPLPTKAEHTREPVDGARLLSVVSSEEGTGCLETLWSLHLPSVHLWTPFQTHLDVFLRGLFQ